MKLGIVSDTHDNIELAEEAVNFFEKQECEVVIHCGDMVAPFTAELFDAEFEFHAVRGNNDGEWNLKSTVNQFGEFYNNIAELEVEGLKICVYHGTEEEIVEGLVGKDYDFVFRGHTHEKKVAEHSGTVEVNPGGIRFPDQEERFHVATMDTENRELEFHRIEAS
ncbi:MAG: metallophosphoesterase [Candidatus Nanohalobium sp.]